MIEIDEKAEKNNMILTANEEKNDKFHHTFMINLSDVSNNNNDLELTETLDKVTNCKKQKKVKLTARRWLEQ
jgi:DNA polymerase IIIc chi subunit